MNVFIHQNNETLGPFNADTLDKMLKSGEVLSLTFACLEGETGWRPLSEILSRLEKASPAASPPPPQLIPTSVIQSKIQPGPPMFEPASRADVLSATEAKPPGILKIECSKCGQRIQVDASFAGTMGTCPTCGGPVPIPALIAPMLRPASPKRESIVHSARGFVYGARGFVSRFSGLQPLPEFRISSLFADVFKNRPGSDFDALFNCGSLATTPDPATLGPDLPRPWFYLRMLIFGSLILFALCFGYERFPDPKFLPPLMIAGAFLVPLACVALFFELNVPRNVSAYQVAKLIAGGAIISLPVALFLSTHTNPGFMGTMCSAALEAIAQALIVVALLRNTRQYPWILNGLLAGAAVGAGFAGIESASYFLYAFVDDMGRGDGKLATFYAAFADHAIYVPLGRVAWTTSVAGGLWLAKGVGSFRMALFFRKPFLRILVSVLALRALWNSGLLIAPLEKFSLFNTERALCMIAKVEQGLWLVSLIGSCYLVLLLVQEGLRQLRAGAQEPDPNLETSPKTEEKGEGLLAR